MTADWLLLALAFPAVLINVGHGQNGFLTAALLGGALVVLDRRPLFAGILFGLSGLQAAIRADAADRAGRERPLEMFRRRGGDGRGADDRDYADFRRIGVARVS